MPKQDFLKELALEKILLCDGAMGTELQRRGFKGSCPEEYNVTYPEAVKEIYSDYLSAGSDIIETNTFGANRLRLGRHGFSNRVAEFNRRAVELAREVCPDNRFVAGSIGPTGGIIEPFGDLAFSEAYGIFAEQAKVLADSGADAVFIETMLALDEMEAAIQAVKRNTCLPVVATMVFKLTQNGLRTGWGVTVFDAVQKLTELGVDVVGVNCSCPADAVAVIKEMRSLTDKPLIVQPNIGKDMKSFAEELLSLEVNILGGCCETGPSHIRMMRDLIDTLKGYCA